MKRVLKKSIAIILTMLFVCGCFTASATTVNGKQHLDYGSYVLLGDSIASGWSDIEDRDTCFTRVEGSYGAHIADDLGVTYHPRACIGFRTLEMRYMLEDDFVGDKYMFYSVEQEYVDSLIPTIREEIANAGLITLNVGGNDWGSYLGWNVMDEMDKYETVNEEFFVKVRELIETTGADRSTINTIIDIAAACGCLPELVKIIPQALEKGITEYFTNWNIMIEDIYALNPDVTLVVIGMFDSGLQDESMSDPENAGGGFDIQNFATKVEIGAMVTDIANIPMKQGAEKYGYIFVDPVGTLCEKQHPSYAGHRHIADLVLEALPDASFPYTDLTAGTREYNDVQKLYAKGVMKGVTATEFAPEAALTKGQLAEALYVAAGAPEVTSSLADTDAASAAWAVEKGILTADAEGNFAADREVTRFAFAQALLKDSMAEGFDIMGLIRGFRMFLKVILENLFGIVGAIERIDAAQYFVIYFGF